MSTESDRMIVEAISNKKILEFNYDGYHRIAEPHVYGRSNGTLQILVYQIEGGSSSGGLPQWRRADVDRISDMQVTNRDFAGRRPYPSGKHSSFDEVIMIVDP